MGKRNPDTHFYGAAWSQLTGLGYGLAVALAVIVALAAVAVIAAPSGPGAAIRHGIALALAPLGRRLHRTTAG